MATSVGGGAGSPRLQQRAGRGGEKTKPQIPNTRLQRNPGIETPKTKLQTLNKFQVPSSKPRPALRAWSLELGASLELEFGVWDLEFLWSLVFGIWSFNWLKDFSSQWDRTHSVSPFASAPPVQVHFLLITWPEQFSPRFNTFVTFPFCQRESPRKTDLTKDAMALKPQHSRLFR